MDLLINTKVLLNPAVSIEIMVYNPTQLLKSGISYFIALFFNALVFYRFMNSDRLIVMV